MNTNKTGRLVRLKAPEDLENLRLVEEDQPEPRTGELLVRIRANSLNFHDDMVVLGKIRCADGRIPMSDGAGEVIEVGDGVEDFKVGVNVFGTFWPYWLGGEMMNNSLKPFIDRSFLLQEIVAGFKYYESQKHFGKVCLEL